MSRRLRARPWFGVRKPYGIIEQLRERDSVFVVNLDDLLGLYSNRIFHIPVATRVNSRATLRAGRDGEPDIRGWYLRRPNPTPGSIIIDKWFFWTFEQAQEFINNGFQFKEEK